MTDWRISFENYIKRFCCLWVRPGYVLVVPGVGWAIYITYQCYPWIERLALKIKNRNRPDSEAVPYKPDKA